MEGDRKPTDSSSSSSYSISYELFGSKGSSPSSANSNSTTSKGIFDSVFAPPSSYQRSEMVGSWRNRDDSEYQGWNSKQESQGNTTQCSKGEGQDQDQDGTNKGRSIFQDERAEPCYLSSSIYYGGQDVYSDPSKPQSSVSPHIFKKDGDDKDSASRGNWWQGSLYY